MPHVALLGLADRQVERAHVLPLDAAGQGRLQLAQESPASGRVVEDRSAAGRLDEARDPREVAAQPGQRHAGQPSRCPEGGGVGLDHQWPHARHREPVRGRGADHAGTHHDHLRTRRAARRRDPAANGTGSGCGWKRGVAGRVDMRGASVPSRHAPAPCRVPFRAGDLRWPGCWSSPTRAADAAPMGAAAPLVRPAAIATDRFDRDGHPGWFADRTDGERGLLARLAAALADARRRLVPLRRARLWGVRGQRGRRATCSAGSTTRATPSRPCARTAGSTSAARASWHTARVRCSASASPSATRCCRRMTLIGAPARSLRDVMRRGAAERARTGIDRDAPVRGSARSWDGGADRAGRPARGWRCRSASGRDATSLGLAGWKQTFDTPGLALATMLHRSVTLVHGERDAWVDPEESDLLARRSARGRKRAASCAASRGVATTSPRRRGRRHRAIAADLAERLVPHELPPVLLAIEGEPPTG